MSDDEERIDEQEKNSDEHEEVEDVETEKIEANAKEDIDSILEDIAKQSAKPSKLESMINTNAEPENKEEKTTKNEEEKSEFRHKKLPEREFFEWIIQNKPHLFKSKNHPKILQTIYDNPDLPLTEIAERVGVAYSTVYKAIDKLNELYEEYYAEYTNPKATSPAPLVPVVEEQTPNTRPIHKNNAPRENNREQENEQEKIYRDWYAKSLSTTTFREVDKALSKALGVQFHRHALEQEVYARIGELLVFSLLQLGVVDRDKIVNYSEKLVEDHNLLYEYIKTQFDSILRITDPETLMKTWQENMLLRRKLIQLQATADMLSDVVHYYENVVRFLTSILDREQTKKYITYIYALEYLRKLKLLEGGVMGGEPRN